MAKHAKPTLASTLSKTGARGAAALAVASAGLLATGPAAFAGGDNGHHDGHHNGHHDGYHDKSDGDTFNSSSTETHESEGIINVADNDVLVPIQVCNNYVPINVLGVQVPLEDVDVPIAVPILTEGDTEAEADSGDSCGQVANAS